MFKCIDSRTIPALPFTSCVTLRAFVSFSVPYVVPPSDSPNLQLQIDNSQNCRFVCAGAYLISQLGYLKASQT